MFLIQPIRRLSLTLGFLVLSSWLLPPPAGAGGSLLRSGRSEETFLLRLQEANGGQLGAALRRSERRPLQ